ncbi:MAG: TlpA disulfide reductase family protein [Phycisphaerales bacterium]
MKPHTAAFLVLTAFSLPAIPLVAPCPGAAPRSEPQKKTDPKAAELLARATTAWKEVHTLSYAAVSTGEGVEQRARVVCQRADAGGWKVAVHVSDEPDAPVAAAGYDGVTARVVKPHDQTVVERTVDTLEDLRVFLTGQGLRQFIAWDVLEDQGFAGAQALTLAKPETVEGVACDVLEVTLKDDEAAPATDAPKPDAKNKETPAPPSVRVFIGREDNLPRRIERTRTSAGKPATRTLVLQDIARNADADAAQFALEVPDGYRIRAGDAAKANRAQRPGADARAGAKPDIEGVTWPHDPALLPKGEKAPAFRLEDPKGAWKRLSDFQGKVVVLDFWATWCGPCVAAIPAIQAVHEKYGDKVVVLGMDCEGDPMQGKDAVDPVKFKEEKGGHYTTLLNADSVSGRYKVRGIPTFYVIDANGKVLWAGVGLGGPPENQSPTLKDRQDYLTQTISAVIDAELKKMGEK